MKDLQGVMVGQMSCRNARKGPRTPEVELARGLPKGLPKLTAKLTASELENFLVQLVHVHSNIDARKNEPALEKT